TRGLGRALALEYAGPGRILGLAGRNAGLLSEIATECEARGAEVRQGIFDLEDEHATRAWISAQDEKSPVDLLIVNAGQFGGVGPSGALEPLDDALRQVRVNLLGAMTTIDAALMGMRRRCRGHIAIVTSLAALQPLADAPTYSASKAGLAA